MVDARTPVIVGAAQVIYRPGDPAALAGPISLMADAVRAAAADAGAPPLVGAAEWMGAVGGWWSYQDPAGLVAAVVGAAPAVTALTAISGSAPQELLGIVAHRILHEGLDVAVIMGGETRYTRQRLKREGTDIPWVTEAPGEPTERLVPMPSILMDEADTLGPNAQVYPLFEIARRAHRGEEVEEHRSRIAALWAGFNTVAVANPYAWDRTPMTAWDIRDPSPGNRMISWPYTKAMVANNTVDMGSALILCSAEAAQRHGVPRERWVFPHVVTKANETLSVLERQELYATPAVGVAGLAALQQARVSVDDLAYIDLYACFPAIVQMACDALGLRQDRPLTVTGGLGFAAAPVGNAAGQSIAALVERVRQDPGSFGFVHANGGNATKHAFGVYSTTPPTAPFVFMDCQDQVDLQPRRAEPADYEGDGLIESYTVVHDRQGAVQAVFTLRTPYGGRALGRSADPAVFGPLMTEELVGMAARRQQDGTVTIE